MVENRAGDWSPPAAAVRRRSRGKTMSMEYLSRRSFMAGLATAGAASASAAAQSGRDPVVAPTYPTAQGGRTSGPVRVVCSERITPEQAAQFRAVSPRIELTLAQDRAVLQETVRDADAVLGRIDRDSILAARSLKWVQTWAAGVETLPRELMEHSCVLTNMQRVFAPVIAETAVAMMLGLTRGLVQHAVPNFRERKWAPAQVPLDDLLGKTLGLVGLGGIGSETARRVHYGFGMKVLAVDPKPIPKPEFVEVLREPAWLMEMVPQVDCLMSAAPLTKETKGMFNETVFRGMKKSALFINVSRGGLVDQPALVRALKEGWIRGAGLDVATPEPLPADNPLWDCPNLVITPHNSGSAPIREVRLIALVTENLRRYVEGLPLLNVVDKQRGY
jgi:phosphoglycerate dehydrogenase-like enzyme